MTIRTKGKIDKAIALVPYEGEGDSSLSQLVMLAQDLCARRGVRLTGTQRILLINPFQMSVEFFDRSLLRRQRYFNYPPYGLGLLAAHLAGIDVEVDLLDVNHEILSAAPSTKEDVYELERRTVTERIGEFRPTIIGVTCMFTMTHDSFKRVASLCRSTLPSALIVGGGVHVSNDMKRIVEEVPQIDLLFPHESEHLFRSFVSTLLGKEVPAGDVEERYIPDYKDLRLSDYSKHGEIGSYRFLWSNETIAATVQSNRGCRARCSFCSVEHFNGKGVRGRTIGSVIDELKTLVEVYGINHIMWLDDDLFYTEDRAIVLFNEIVKANLGITWDASNGVIASAVTEEILYAARESGCIGMHVGIESGNDRILRSIRKPSGRKHFLRCGELLLKFPEIFTKGFLIVGFPNETPAEIWDTISLAKEMALDWYTVSLLTPLPSTDIYDQMLEMGLLEGTDKNGARKTNYGSMQLGIQKRLEEGGRTTLSNVFDLSDFDPTKPVPREHLASIWFEVDYEINYSSKFSMTDKNKLTKRLRFLHDVNVRMTLCNNPLVLQHIAMLIGKLGVPIDDQDYNGKAMAIVNQSELWTQRYNRFISKDKTC